MSRWSLPMIGLLVVGLAGGVVAERTLHGQQQPVVTGIPKELTSYRDIVKQVLPAVVSIESRAKPKVKMMNQPRGRRGQFDDSQVPEEFRRFFEQFGGQFSFPDVPDEMPRSGFGSGFIVDPKGVILTNYHVVAGADTVQVTLADGRKLESKDIKFDRKTDLAIIRVEGKGPFPYMELGDSDQSEIGDRVLAIGAPFGLTGTVTHGIISHKGRNGLSMNMYEDFIQTDAAINPGNSGGPLVGLDGRVVGINSAIKSRSGGFQGVGLAISSNMAKSVMKQLLENGTVHRGYLGVVAKPVNPDVAGRLGLKDSQGALVSRIYDGSPAAKAGVQAGDVITSVNGKPIKDAQALVQVVLTLPLGKPTDLVVVREGKHENLKVTIEEQPEDYGLVQTPEFRQFRNRRDAVTMDTVGVEVTDLTPESARQLGFNAKAKGALITGVDRNSPAGEAGLRNGMLITKVDNTPVKSADEFRSQVESGSLSKGMMLHVQAADGSTDFLMLKSTDSAKERN